MRKDESQRPDGKRQKTGTDESTRNDELRGDDGMTCLDPLIVRNSALILDTPKSQGFQGDLSGSQGAPRRCKGTK